MDLHADLYKLSLDRYHRMIEAGILGEDDRVELLHGVLVAREPTGPSHAEVSMVMNDLLVRGVGKRFRVRPALPLTIPREESEPEPDFSVVPANHKRSEHPQTALLVVEVSNTSLRRDRLVKSAIYAAAGVREYWVVDVKGQRVEVFRKPNRRSRRYASVRTIKGDHALAPLEPLEGPRFRIAELFR